ncbi:glycosyltransferase [Candidatus Pelagibacter sp.]|jgi:glycosyltransferase involved in cell wall biosynthesis|nr:glycosyltransferase [Candidatus Pelagibacter sp.]|tara:strand:+ start:87 stop:932 length:846 start_codon:yes stop_codon:yes gene_type:complete
MTKLKTVSTLIPTFNREIYLKKAIQSCLNQTVDHEIIVCNHGGTDGTDKMISEFEGEIKYIKRKKDYGPHYCWLEGVMEASGEYINLLFDDDWIEPKFIEECMKYFDNSDVGFVFSSANIYNDSDKKIIASGQNNFFSRSGIYNISKYESFFLKHLMSPTSFIIRKKDMIDCIFQGRLPFSEYTYKGVGPDRLMILMCMLRYKNFGYVSESLSFYRSHADSITIDSHTDNKKKYMINKSYEDILKYYYSLKYGRYFSFFKNKYIIHLRYHFNLFLNKIINR